MSGGHKRMRTKRRSTTTVPAKKSKIQMKITIRKMIKRRIRIKNEEHGAQPGQRASGCQIDVCANISKIKFWKYS